MASLEDLIPKPIPSPSSCLCEIKVEFRISERRRPSPSASNVILLTLGDLLLRLGGRRCYLLGSFWRSNIHDNSNLPSVVVTVLPGHMRTKTC